jgi:serine/threonine protein kinase
VLLDAAGNGKVADFGTARKGVSHASDNTHATTALVAGTKCYMPPEVSNSAQVCIASAPLSVHPPLSWQQYVQDGHCSEKTDAYGKNHQPQWKEWKCMLRLSVCLSVSMVLHAAGRARFF